jgi:manganese efflux pump family protein
MSILEILFLALALSIDAFAVTLSAAAAGSVTDGRATFRLSFHFGLFQFMMPVLGWTAGLALAPVIVAVDHWIAFGLLSVVGARMIRTGFQESQRDETRDPSRGMTLMALAVATSIDALAVGLSLAFLNTDILWPSLIIGAVTGTVCLVAVKLGRRFRAHVGDKAEIVGGIILIAIALRILIAHTMG